MSKSRGNVVDPLEVMDEIGADALRFTLTAMAAPGMDIPLSEGRMQGYRQFINKIWNASRFVLLSIGEVPSRPSVPTPAGLAPIHRWILHRLNAVTAEVDEGFRSYRFDTAANSLYHFFWHEYADWYIELVKPHLQAGGAERDEAVAVILEVHDTVLRLLHPIIPFVTEEVWQKLPRRDGEGATITLAAFPAPRADRMDEAVSAEIELLQGVVTTIRTARAERGVKPSAKVGVTIEGAGPDQRRILGGLETYLRTLAGLDALQFAERIAPDPDTVTRVFGDLRVHIRMPHRDREAEIEKLKKTLADTDRDLAAVAARLANESFVSRAPADVVRGARERQTALLAQREKIGRTLREMEARAD
jgi:valyl-tRNA synthetase